MASKSAHKPHASSLHGALKAAIALAIVVSCYLSFEFGRIQSGFNVVHAVNERGGLETTIIDLEKEIASLKEQVALQETHREIERAAYKEVENNLLVLEQKIQEQRDAIAFYRGIISPADGGRGLRVQDLKLTKGPDDRQYNVKLVLVQVMQHDRSVQGEVDFSLEGAQDGVATTYALEQLMPEDANSNWPFQFRYFQDFNKQLTLPVGFEPQRINIEVRSRTKSIASVKQSFLWQSGQG